MDTLLRDLRYAARMLRKTPAASLIAITALALGIGLTTLMFSIIYGVLIRPFPFEQPESLVEIMRTRPADGVDRMGTTIHDFAEWRAQQSSFEELGAFSWSGGFTLAGDGGAPERLEGALLTASVLTVLRARAQLGRLFTPEDGLAGAQRVMLIGWGVWQQRFGGDPDILGRSVRLNGELTTIVGVMPRGFGFPNAQNAWMPLHMDPVQVPRGEGPMINVLGRLRAGVSLERARADLATIAQRLATDHPATNEGIGVRAAEYGADRMGAEERAVFYAMFGAVVFVLLIACSNVANLLIGRAMMRTKEIGVRTALGASRWRVVTQFLAESLVLALAGAVLGTLIAAFGVHAFNAAIEGTRPPYWLTIRLDGPALLCAFAATLLAGLAAGAIPALQAARANTQDTLKDEARGSSSFRLGRVSRGLIVAEMALSVGLLVGAGLMIKSVVKLYTIDPGFDATRLFHARLNLSDTVYARTEERLLAAEALLARVESAPGIEAAILASIAPGLGGGRTSFELEGQDYARPQDYPYAANVIVTPGFFSVLGVEVISGREFTTGDRDGSDPVAIVNRSFERRYFPGQSALAKRLRLGGVNSTAPWLTVVGVAPDLYAGGLSSQNPEGIYRAMTQAPSRGLTILARTRMDPTSATSAIRTAVAAVDADLALQDIGSLYDVIQENNWHYGVFGTLFVAFGLAALFLASVGLYGVMAFSVSRRRREIGVRMAVGAESRHVLALIFRQGMSQTALGLVIGTLIALGVSRVLAALLFQVEPRDPFIFASIAVVLLASAGLACWIPAMRAARVDPLTALHQE